MRPREPGHGVRVHATDPSMPSHCNFRHNTTLHDYRLPSVTAAVTGTESFRNRHSRHLSRHSRERGGSTAPGAPCVQPEEIYQITREYKEVLHTTICTKNMPRGRCTGFRKHP